MENTFRNLALSLLEDYQDYTRFYTDRSKTEADVRATVYSQNTIKMTKLLDFYSIYTAEAYATSQALKIIKQHKIDKSLILSTL